LLKTPRQPTTCFALVEAHQVGAVPEFSSTLCLQISRLKLEAAWSNTFSCLETSEPRDSAGFQVNLSINQISLEATECAAPGHLMFQSLRYSKYRDTCISL
ncbi:hypothetical protein T265_12811, partial [Opisthorchis viverrini]